jgi:Kef-type K+ transport system membrane component KefB
MVQLETLAQFGIFFILFVLGLEFNLQKLSSTLRMSVWGSFSMLVIDVLLVAIIAVIGGRQSLASGYAWPNCVFRTVARCFPRFC